jgi:DNA polymerase I-like protein with 3'-5' exonuclease and polymerase domains
MVETFWGTLFPDAFEYLEGVRAEADKYPHIVRTPFLGRLGWFPAIPLDDSSLQWERWRASSFMMQGSCATFFKMMSVVLHRKLPRGARIILTIYDAVLLEVPLNLVQDVAFLCKSTMRRPTGFKGVLKVRTRVGPSWGEMEELKPTWSSRSSR